jgi:hypothetical protein
VAADKFPFPSVIYGNAPLVTAPNVVTVTFAGDTLAAQLESFGSTITSSPYWTTVTAGLCGSGSTCIGAGTGVSTTVATAPGSSYADSSEGGATTPLQTYLQTLIAAFPASMQPTADTVYTFYFPASTTITLDGATSCEEFDGYHNSMTMGNQTVIYAIVPECPPEQGVLPTTEIANATVDASHEILEATTDGINSNTTGGYYLDFNQQSSLAWNDAGGGELGDLCVDLFGLGQDETMENGFTVQRIWSIANAASGTKDPCVPIPTGEIYYNAFPTVSAVIVDVGKSQTFEVDALATGSMASWTVAVADSTDQTGQTTYLSFSIAGGQTQKDVGYLQMSSGQTAQVTVTMLKDPSTAQGSEGWGDATVYSTNGTNPQTATSGHFWPFIVLTSAQAKMNGITMTEDPIHHGTFKVPARKTPAHSRAARSRVRTAFDRYLSTFVN